VLAMPTDYRCGTDASGPYLSSSAPDTCSVRELFGELADHDGIHDHTEREPPRRPVIASSTKAVRPCRGKQ